MANLPLCFHSLYTAYLFDLSMLLEAQVLDPTQRISCLHPQCTASDVNSLNAATRHSAVWCSHMIPRY